MKTFVSFAAAIALIWLGVAAAQQSQQTKKAAPAAKKGAASGTARKSSSKKRTAASKKGSSRKSTATWRNRQMSPAPERYREIQEALASRGYLSREEVTGNWNQASVDALRRFQAQQNIEATGKINSLSLIALGLGPKRDPAPAMGVPAVQQPHAN